MAGEPIKVRKGERVEIEMMNMSMMAHPMHLHGHHFQVTGIDGTPFNGAVRDTVLVPPMQSVRFAFDANNPAEAWAFHCHHLYHMASGMMSAVSYELGMSGHVPGGRQACAGDDPQSPDGLFTSSAI